MSPDDTPRGVYAIYWTQCGFIRYNLLAFIMLKTARNVDCPQSEALGLKVLGPYICIGGWEDKIFKKVSVHLSTDALGLCK